MTAARVYVPGVVCLLCGAKRIRPEHIKTNGEGRQYHNDEAECWGEVVKADKVSG